ncbi:MAG: COG1361 family protein [Candidatus Syntropharchaeales archaeon]
MKKVISVLTWVLILLFSCSLPAAASGLTITTSTSSSEITTGSSITLTVQVSNTGTTSQSGVTIEIDLSSANGGLSLNATTTDLQDQTESQTISAGNSVTKSWTIYGFSAGSYANQIQINVKQSGTDITGSPVYESVTVKDPARFTTPTITTTTAVDLGDTFTFNVTTQNSGDYAIQNAVASISASGFTVEDSSGTTSTSIAADAIFTPGWTLNATSSGTKTVTVTLSADNAASVTASETITVSGTSTPTPTPTPTPTSTQNQVVGGGGGGGSSTTTNVPVDIYGKVKSTTILRSDDGKASLTIEEGTVATSRSGSSVSYISMVEVSFEDAIIAYEFGPNGATFDPAIELEFRYDSADIPENADEEDLVIKVYENGSWNTLDTTIDTTAHTATTKVEHFTPFALMLPETSPAIPADYFTETNPEEETNVQEKSPTATPAPAKTSRNGATLVGVILIVAIIAAGIGVYYYKKR